MSSDDEKKPSLLRTVKATNRTTRVENFVSFFPDDTVETVRQYIGDVANVHPDRLFITVTLQRPSTYFKDDPRRWEALFQRMSYLSGSILPAPFQVYQSQIRMPSTAVAYEDYGPDEWKHQPEQLMALYAPAEDFKDQLILGTEEGLSYVLPYEYDTALTSKIPAAAYPIPQKTALMTTLYPRIDDILEFTYTTYDSSAETSKPVYFPFLQSTTPEQMTEANIQLLRDNRKRLSSLLELTVPESKLSILRAHFRLPLVETDFGSAVRTRFEQMFYGLTVSESIPSISFFTSPSENARHKFYVKDSRNKMPQNLARWQRWWSVSKPTNARPTLVLYRGESNDNFDRITLTSTKLTLTAYRPEGSEDDMMNLKESLSSWLLSLDAIVPFLAIRDIGIPRWELQDMSLSLKYRTKYKDPHLLRFNCISSTFALTDADTSTFQLLRTDHSVDGLSSMEVKVIQLIHDKTNVSVADIQAELGVSLEVATTLKTDVARHISENPNTLTRSFRGFPTMTFGDNTVVVKGVKDLPLSVKYANLLRFILLNSDASKLNKICPPRKEVVRAETTIVAEKELEVNTKVSAEDMDLFADVGEDEVVEEAEAETEVDTKEEQQPAEEQEDKKLKTKKGRKTTYNYFNARLQAFDNNTFDPTNSKYPKKCDQDHQPIILSQEDLDRIAETPYDPRKYSEAGKTMPVTDPDGLVVCPEYWCIEDEIPLRKEDLKNNACPVCGGKIRSKGKKTNEDTRIYTVIERGNKSTWPALISYASPKNGRQMPCCRDEPYKAPEKEFEDKFYILSETKINIPKYRCAFLSKKLMDSLFITETYQPFLKGDIKRILAPNSGFFRVGMGKPSKDSKDSGGPVETLPRFLGCVKVNGRPVCARERVRVRQGEGEKEMTARENGKWFKIPTPRASIDNLLGCSFVTTWKEMGDTHLDEIALHPKCANNEVLARIVSGIDKAFHEKRLTALEELEYAAICLQCDVFRIDMEANTLGCMFHSPVAKPRSRGIIVLKNGQDLDILANVIREDELHIKGSNPNDITDFGFRSNIFQPPFLKSTYVEVEKLRNLACSTTIPSYTDAQNALQEILPMIGESEYSIILDPYARAQAFYVPYKLVLPFQASPLPPTSQSTIQGYTGITPPTYEDARAYILTAMKHSRSKGFDWKEDIHNMGGERVEIMLQSGLRIPVVPSPADIKTTPVEVIQTVQNIGEENLAFGEEDVELQTDYAEISYASEVFDFLLFELSKDIQERYPDLYAALRKTQPLRPEVEPLLREWFADTTFGVDLKNADQFVTKVRAPCGTRTKDQCSGNVCGWDGDRCKIQVKNSLREGSLFNRLMSTLVSNAKIRGIVLDGRSTPFFSTILYVVLPHELILTDKDLK